MVTIVHGERSASCSLAIDNALYTCDKTSMIYIFALIISHTMYIVEEHIEVSYVTMTR
jgi:hypothetical protein